MFGTPLLESILFRPAAVEKFFQHSLSVRTKKKICHEQSSVRMRRIDRNGSAADVRRHEIHRNPLHRRSLGCREQGVGLKYRRRRDDLSRGDVVDERRGLDRIKLYFLPFELFNRLFAFGLNHSADDFITCLTDADAHSPLKLWVKKALEILGDSVFGYKRRVVSKPDIGFPCQRPINESLPCWLLAVFWVRIEIR